MIAPRLVKVVKEMGLVCVSYGAINNEPEKVKLQVQEGIDAVIVDSVLAIRKGLTGSESERGLGCAAAAATAAAAGAPIGSGVDGVGKTNGLMSGNGMGNGNRSSESKLQSPGVTKGMVSV